MNDSFIDALSWAIFGFVLVAFGYFIYFGIIMSEDEDDQFFNIE